MARSIGGRATVVTMADNREISLQAKGPDWSQSTTG